MNRMAQADDMLLKAVQQIEKDPMGSLSVQRATALATIAQALMMRAALDGNATQGPPW